MSDLGKFIGGFGEQLAKTLESERKRKKEEDQFNQDMAYKYRQQNLLMNIRQKEFDYGVQQDRLKAEQEFTPLGKDFNLIPENLRANAFKGSDYPEMFGQTPNYFISNTEIPKVPEDKTNFEFKSKYNPKRGVNEIFWVDKNDPEAEPKYYGDEKPDKTGTEEEKGVFFDVSKSNDLINEYSRFQSDNIDELKPEKGKEEETRVYTLKDEAWGIVGDKLRPKTLYTKEQIGAKRTNLMKKIETETNEEARRIGEKVKGFYSLYQAAINEMTKSGRKDVINYVNEKYGDLRSETREILKTQLKKRIF